MLIEQRMNQGDFELLVCTSPETDPEEDTSGKVELEHGQGYALPLFNHGNLRCDVGVTIDGKFVGKWRVPAKDFIAVERPVRHEGRFTFFRLGTPEAKVAGISTDASAGWIEARFVPETKVKGKLFEGAWLGAANPAAEDDAGGTGYTGKSEQVFQDADDIFSLDEAAAVTIRLRLKCADDEKWSLSEKLQYAVDRLAAEIKAMREGDDYLAPEHLEKMDRLTDLKIDLRFAKFQEQHPANAGENVAHAEYARLPMTVLDCPDCKKQSRVPKGSGHIRIKCPHCACQFVRDA